MTSNITDSLRDAEHVIDCMNEGVYVTDTRRRIVLWNKGAERITGWSAEDVIGTSCFDAILAHVDIDGHRLCGKEFCPLHRAITTGESSSVPLILYALTKWGSRVPVQATVAPILDDEGNIIGGVESFRDMSVTVNDLRLARQIQDETMTTLLPVSDWVEFEAHTTPTGIVGGDFYRIEAIGSETYACMLADVVGHGAAAALQTMLLRALWEEFRSDMHEPAAFMAKMNDRLALLTDDGSFATAIYGVLDARGQRFNYCRAGHEPPIVIDGKLLAANDHGPPLGIMPKAEYEAPEQPLEPGQSVFLFSDGAYEAMNRDGEQFGLERLRDQLLQSRGLGPATRFRRLEEALLKFSHSIRLVDDITLVGFHLMHSA